MTDLRIYRNSTPVKEDKFAKSIPTKDSNTFTSSLAIFWAQTLAFTQASTPAWAFVFTPGLPSMYTDINLQKTTRLALKLFIKDQEYDKTNFAS